MKTLIKIGSIVCFIASVMSAKAEIIGSGKINGVTYFVDVVHSGTSQQIVLRRFSNACSSGDIIYADVAGVKTTLGNAARTLCKAKDYYDNGKTILGCTSVAVTVGCATAAVATDGAGAAFCGAAMRVSVPYAMRRGAADCVEGLADKIAQAILGDRTYASIGLGVGVGTKQWKDATTKAIDLLCTYTR